MKIATWNVERLKHAGKTLEIIEKLEEVNADILVLTETDSRIDLKIYPYKYETASLHDVHPEYYNITENRVTIYSKYKLLRKLETYDNLTSCCGEFETENGNLIVYGTIIGIYGNRHENFKEDIEKQLVDFQNLSINKNVCIVGDYNISFGDNYYYTKLGRYKLNKSFDNNKLILATREVNECIDHIAVSQKYIENQYIKISEWNTDKKLSDHKGICVDIRFKNQAINKWI